MRELTVELRGGANMQRYLEQLRQNIGRGTALKVGFLEDAKYPDGTQMAFVAFVQEYGARGIPSRAFFRPMVAEKSPAWGNEFARILRAAQFDMLQALDLLGQRIRGQLVASLRDRPQLPLSPVTLMLRKMKDDDPTLRVTGSTVIEAIRRVSRGLPGATGTRAKPLNDTGALQRSADYEVVPR